MPCCEACTSSQREVIDAALVAGRPLVALAAEMGVTVTTLAGHREHLWPSNGNGRCSQRRSHAAHDDESRVQVALAALATLARAQAPTPATAHSAADED